MAKKKKKAKAKKVAKKAKKTTKKATKKVAKKAAKRASPKKTTKKVTAKKVTKKPVVAKKAKSDKPHVPSLEEITKDSKVVIPTTNPFATNDIKSDDEFSRSASDLEDEGIDGDFKENHVGRAADLEADDYDDMEDDEDEGGTDEGGPRGGGYFKS